MKDEKINMINKSSYGRTHHFKMFMYERREEKKTHASFIFSFLFFPWRLCHILTIFHLLFLHHHRKWYLSPLCTWLKNNPRKKNKKIKTRINLCRASHIVIIGTYFHTYWHLTREKSAIIGSLAFILFHCDWSLIGMRK